MATVPIRTVTAVHDVELEGLSPRAAAIARIWTANRLHSPCPLVLESARTMREMGADPAEVALWWGHAAMDRPHRMVLDLAGKLPGGRFDLADRGALDNPQERAARFREQLERIAQQLPFGYIPVGGGEERGLALDVEGLRTDDPLLTREQVVRLLRQLGRPLSPATIANYRRNPPAGWPQPAKYTGRTPLWSQAAIEGYARESSSTTTRRVDE